MQLCWYKEGAAGAEAAHIFNKVHVGLERTNCCMVLQSTKVKVERQKSMLCCTVSVCYTECHAYDQQPAQYCAMFRFAAGLLLQPVRGMCTLPLKCLGI